MAKIDDRILICIYRNSAMNFKRLYYLIQQNYLGGNRIVRLEDKGLIRYLQLSIVM